MIYHLAGGATTVTAIARGYAAYASDAPGTVWLVTYPRTTSSMNGRASLQQIPVSGQPLGSPVRLPAGYLPVRAAGQYLVLGPVDEGPSTVLYKLWDPRTGQVVRTLPDVIAVGPEQIAWGPTCSGCSVHLLSLSTGRRVSVPLAPLTWGYNGTFSADGRYLALQLSTSTFDGGMAVRTAVAVIDTTTGHLTVLPGTVESPRARYQWSFGWLAGADQLIIALPLPRDTLQVASWRPGQHHLQVATATIPAGMYPMVSEVN